MATAAKQSPANDLGAAALSWVQSAKYPDLTFRQTALIVAVADRLCPPTVRGLASFLDVSKPVITRALNSLGEMRVTQRVPDTEDRRSLFVCLTPRGDEIRSAMAA